MGNVLLLLVLVGVVVFLTLRARKRAQTPEHRLRVNFKGVKKSILSGLKDASARKEATRILDESEEYLEGLIRARQQQAMLNEMMQAGADLMGTRPAKKAEHKRTVWGADQLEKFFAQLSRLAAMVTIQDEEALHALKDFATDLEEQRQILRELTDDLARTPDERSFDERLQNSEQPEEDTEEVGV